MSVEVSEWMQDLLEIHFEDLAALWNQRLQAIRSPAYSLSDVCRIDERIEAHTDAIVLAGLRGLPLALGGLTEDRNQATANAFALLAANDEGVTARVIAVMKEASGEALLGLIDALKLGYSEVLIETVQRAMLDASRPTVIAALAEVLAARRNLRWSDLKHYRFLQDPDPSVRRLGWAIVGHLGHLAEPGEFAEAMRDDDKEVKRAALEAGAWSRAEDMMTLARRMAETPKPEEYDTLYLLAVLGTLDDLASFEQIVNLEELGPARYLLAAAYGHPALVDHVLAGFVDPDPATAAAAGEAFTKMTGVDVESNERVALTPKGGKEVNAFDAAFHDEVTLPSEKIARSTWDKHARDFSAATRICRGFDIQRELDAAAFVSLDMESRWEISLRSKYYGIWDGWPLSLEVFPQRY